MKKLYCSCFFMLISIIAILVLLPSAQAVDFIISGQVNRAFLWGDNGNDDDLKFVDNANSSTRFRFTGSNEFDENWKVGFIWENQMQSNSSSDTDIDIGENDDTADVNFTERHMDIYVEHSMFGKLSLGQGHTASDGTSEVDLSGTTVINYSGIVDMAGGFTFRTGDDTIVTSIGAAFSNFDGFSRRDRVRYDTPKFGPVYFSVSAMNGQSWDLAGRFACEWDGVGKLAAAAHYTGADTQRDPFKQASGSISFLHSSGFNITASAGGRFDQEGRDKDPWNLYGKLGYKFGKWALSADYTYSKHVGADQDKAQSAAGTAVFNPWKSVEFYGGYRWHKLERDTVSNIKDVHAIMVGGRVKF